MYKDQSTYENSSYIYSISSDVDKMRYPNSNVLTNLTNLIRIQNANKTILKSVSAIPIKSYSSKKCKAQELLKFPAIKLEETIPKFLKTAQPLLTETEFKETEKVSIDFIDGEGKELQKLLEKAAGKEENWLADRWLRVAYLQYRDPVTVYSSPGMTFPLTSFSSEEKWCEYTANIINCLAQFKVLVDECKMPVVKMGKFELDNSQFGKVFGTNRTPSAKQDMMEWNPDSKHVVVIYKGHFFKMPILTKDNKAIHPKTLKSALTGILNHKLPPAAGYGILTTDNRDNWAEAYCILRNLPGNENLLSEIQSSLFTVSMDNCVEYNKDKVWDTHAAQLIHGGGSDQNAANRWMDKTIQLVVNSNGMSGFTYEHSPAEGQPIAMMMDFCIPKLKEPSKLEGVEDNNICVEHLRFADANPCIEHWLEVAKRNVNNLARSLHINVMQFEGYGKHFIKTSKMSPDSFIQIALQYAFFKMYEEPAAHYESAHLRIYAGGRTETIRSCSIESVNFAKAMVNKGCKDEERVQLLRKAVNGHREYTNMALQGKGVDRHLLGLKLMAIENKLPIPKFYSTPGFVKSAHFRLSTSQVATPYEAFMAYGPSVKDGYACCYNPRDCDIFFALSSWRQCETTNADKFGNVLKGCLNEIRELLTKAAESEPPKSKL